MRQYIPLSSFGFYTGGVLDVRLYDFRTEPDLDQKMVTTVSPLFSLRTSMLNIYFFLVWILFG